MLLTFGTTGVDTDGGLWSVAETCVAVVSACLPTFRPLFNKAVRSKTDPAMQQRPYSSGQKSGDIRGTKLTTFKTPWAGERSKYTQTSDTESFARLAE